MIVMMFWDSGGWAWWQAGLMWIAMVAFWGLLIWGICALVTGVTRRNGTGENGGGQPGDARAILDERLASGGIGPEEYHRLIEVLDGRSPAGSGSESGR